MTHFAPPPPPDFDAALHELAPIRGYGQHSGSPSLKTFLEGAADPLRGESELRDQAARVASDAYVWRYLDRVQGREIRRRLPKELRTGLDALTKEVTNPLTTVGRNPSPRPFLSLDEFLTFLSEHLVRNEPSGNPRNLRYPEGGRRAYSLRLPAALKEYLDRLRPLTKNPYSGKTFANLSQLLVFCVHVFMCVEPWRIYDTLPIWRENRSSTRRPGTRETRQASESGQALKFPRIQGMAQVQVRLGEPFFMKLVRTVEFLAPTLSQNSGYRLTMAGFWISAVAWAAYAIDWSAYPLSIKAGGDNEHPLPIAWQQHAPTELLSA